MTILINLAGAPSTGKSTLASKIFSKLKEMGLSAEYSPEYVKGWVYRGQKVRPYDQLFLCGREAYNQSQLFNKVDFAISDSPVYLTAFYHLYANGDNALREICKDFYDMAERLDNVKVLNFYLPLRKEYKNKGRFHSKEQAIEIDHLLHSFLEVEGYEYTELNCPDSERLSVIIDKLSEVTNDFEDMREDCDE